jgi:hypothetical protein
MNHDLVNGDAKGEKQRAGLGGKFKEFFGKKKAKRQTANHGLGRTAGIVWELKASYSSEPVACIVQIERCEFKAKVSIFDSNDPMTAPSLTNVFEEVASGVYLEHLSGEYCPDAVEFFHRNTLPLASQMQWGTIPVSMSWNKATRRFENPSWNGWKPDFEIPPLEKILVDQFRSTAAIAVETWMRKRDEEGRVTPREKELYDRYQEHISEKSEMYRFNLRGGWIFAPSRDR